MNGYLGNARKASRELAEQWRHRRRWVALGAVIALTVGALGMPFAQADVTSGDKPVFVAVSPKRLLDTRFNIGLSGKFSTGVPRLLKITGNVPVAPSGTATVVPAGASGVVLNVTVVNPSKAGFLSVRPGDATGSPSTSNLNFLAGVTIPNEVTIGLPTAGGNADKIQIWYQANSTPGTTDVLVDVVGYYDDHHHDDRYYRKNQTYSKSQVKDIVFDQRTFVGKIAGDGSKLDGGAYTRVTGRRRGLSRHVRHDRPRHRERDASQRHGLPFIFLRCWHDGACRLGEYHVLQRVHRVCGQDQDV